MASIFEHLNKLNVNMQGKNICIFENMSKVNAIKKKIPLWQNQVASDNFSHFPLWHDLMTEHEINFQTQLLPLIEAHLKLLEENFESILLLHRIPHLKLILGYYILSLTIVLLLKQKI